MTWPTFDTEFTDTECRKCGTVFQVQRLAEYPNLGPQFCEPCVIAMRKKEERERQREWMASRLASCNIAERYRTWDKKKAAEIGSNKILDFIRARREKSVWLAGGNGIGKTHAIMYAAFRTITKTPLRCEVWHCHAVLRQIMTYRSSDDKQAAASLISRLCECDILVLDDLGKEKLSESKAEALYEIVDTRDREERRIWITTNHTPKQLHDRLGDNYGSAILKRLERMIPLENQYDNRSISV